MFFHMAWPKRLPEDLTGRRFGRLIAQQLAPYKLKTSIVWECICDCGTPKDVRAACLKRGVTRSCGCLKQELKPPIRIRHGMTSYSGMKVWQGMINRCTNTSDKSYPSYGGRGIRVCDRWLDVRNFAEDMGDKPEGRSLDRIDTNGDYCKENCRWATAAEQGANKRNNRIIDLNGTSLHFSEWCRRMQISPSTVHNRIKSGMDAWTALTLPSRRKRRHK